MGEYVKHKGAITKIGTVDQLYYTTYQKYNEALKSHQLATVYGSRLQEYIRPDAGFRFRFPFPDEDKLPFGQIREPYDRGIPIKVNSGIYSSATGVPAATDEGQRYLEITQQKLLHRESDGKLTLALIIRDPVSKTSMRIEENGFIEKFVREIIRNHMLNENNPETKAFYKQLAARTLKGYRIETPAVQVKKVKRAGVSRRNKPR